MNIAQASLLNLSSFNQSITPVIANNIKLIPTISGVGWETNDSIAMAI